MPSSSTPTLGAGAFTIVTWVKTTRNGEIVQRGSENWPPDAYYYDFAVAQWANGLYFSMNSPSGYSNMCPDTDQSSIITDGNWHQVAITRDSSGMGRMYLDGVLVGTQELGSYNIDSGSTEALTVGSVPNELGLYGSMDDVRIYTRALSASELGLLAAPPVVSIVATDNEASELGDTGTFTVSRTGPTTNALKVYYSISGSNTTNGVTYQQLPGTVVIPAGQSSATVTVSPIDANIPAGSGTVGTVVLTVASDPNSQYYVSNSQTSATVNLDNSNAPVGDWKLNDGSGNTAANSGTGTNLNGTLYNGPTWGTGANAGLTFNGSTNQYVEVPYNSTMSSELSFGTGGFSVSAMVKLAANNTLTDTWNYPILSFGTSSNLLTLSLCNEGGYEWTLGMTFTISNMTYLCPFPDTSNIFRDHQWHMVTVTRDNNNMASLYVDGSLICINLGGGQGRVHAIKMTGPTDANFQDGTGALYIGGDMYGNQFPGSIQNVEYFNYGLTSSQIRLLADTAPVSIVATTPNAYESGSVPGTFTIYRNGTEASDALPLTVNYTIGGTAGQDTDYELTPANVSTTNLAAWWKFDDGSGTTASDATGNGHTGTLVNGPTWSTAGESGGAIQFNGTNQYVDIPKSQSPVLGSGAFTISAWVKITSTSTGTWQTILQQGEWNGSPSYFDLSVDDAKDGINGIYFEAGDGNYYNYITPTTDQTPRSLTANGTRSRSRGTAAAMASCI